jgi:hypothetical protein
MRVLTLAGDAFSDGQVGSKLWLCEELERLAPRLPWKNPAIWVLGGWYGLLPFLLLSRGRFEARSIRSFDIDRAATEAANHLNKNWEIQDWKFRAWTRDADHLDFESAEYGDVPDVIVNTSCEHFGSIRWWENIPAGRLVALQSTDMPQEGHVNRVESIEEMLSKYQPIDTVLFKGVREFRYPDWSFRRYMIIGYKSEGDC